MFAQTLVEIGTIAYTIVLPLLLMIGIGFVLQRALGLDMPTLTRLNFYLVVPGMVYFALVSSALAWADVGIVVGFSLLFMLVLGAITLTVAAARGIPHDQRRAMLMTSIFYNAGNYGLPLQQLAFRPVGRSDDATGMQVFVMIVQNVVSFTIGIVLASGEMRRGRWKRNLGHIFSFPPIYALLAAVATMAVRHHLGDGDGGAAVADALTPFWDTLVYIKDGFFVIALVTLGAQLAMVSRGGLSYPVSTSVALRLLAGPAVGLALIWLLGLDGVTAQVLLISTATPTSVNCVLLCLQFDNHPDFVARSVFYSTVLSPITVTLVILLSRTGLV
ncbi:MAG: AEC family transporter [Phycisphaeraceae bacterium]